MANRSASVICRETLRNIRELTADGLPTNQAADLSLPHLLATLAALYDTTRSLLLTLPDTAFVPESVSSASDVCKAGQIIGHLYETQTNVFLRRVRLQAGLPLRPTAYSPDVTSTYPLLSREGAQVMLDNAQRDVQELFAQITPDAEHDGHDSIRALALHLTIQVEAYLQELEALVSDTAVVGYEDA